MRAFPMRLMRLVLALTALAGSAWASEASKLYEQGRKAEKAGQVTRAYLLYSEAAALSRTTTSIGGAAWLYRRGRRWSPS